MFFTNKYSKLIDLCFSQFPTSKFIIYLPTTEKEIKSIIKKINHIEFKHINTKSWKVFSFMNRVQISSLLCKEFIVENILTEFCILN